MYPEGVSKQSISGKREAGNTVKKYIRQFIAIGQTLEEIDKLIDTPMEALFSMPRQEVPTDQRTADMTALPAGPYKPKHKALVEGAVKIKYRTFFFTIEQRTFFCLTDLNTAIREALEDYNNKLLTGSCNMS